MLSLADGIVVAFTSLGLDTTDKVKQRNIINMVCLFVIFRRIGNSTIIRAEAVYLFCVVWDKRRPSSNHFHVDHFNSIQSRFNLENFFVDLGPRGVEFSGPIWMPARLFINLTNWAFAFLVPFLYGAIYKFRKAHAVTTLGTLRLTIMS